MASKSQLRAKRLKRKKNGAGKKIDDIKEEK